MASRSFLVIAIPKMSIKPTADNLLEFLIPWNQAAWIVWMANVNPVTAKASMFYKDNATPACRFTGVAGEEAFKLLEESFHRPILAIDRIGG